MQYVSIKLMYLWRNGDKRRVRLNAALGWVAADDDGQTDRQRSDGRTALLMYLVKIHVLATSSVCCKGRRRRRRAGGLALIYHAGRETEAGLWCPTAVSIFKWKIEFSFSCLMMLLSARQHTSCELFFADRGRSSLHAT